jgi:hypothetical protein
MEGGKMLTTCSCEALDEAQVAIEAAGIEALTKRVEELEEALLANWLKAI